MKIMYPSLGEIATSPLVKHEVLFIMRIVSFLFHMVVVILGIYTRKFFFFIQLTNLTNILSFLYSIFALISSYQFTMPKFYETTTLTKVYLRQKPSLVAYITQQLQRLSTTMHFVVTFVFWPFVWPTANKDHGMVDIVYFVSAHGLTLAMLLIEGFVSKVQYNWSNLILCYTYGIVYCIFGICVFEFTGYDIYTFFDLRVKSSIFILIGILPFIAAMNGFVILLQKLRDFVIVELVNSKSSKDKVTKRVSKKTKVREEKSYPENSF
uniref:Transmembrane domain-containing protein n=1 Tax=Trepomonas sp. PC1 TaxID=1076344 RepID=A0A146KCT4_9EUKA|eukprot:JAP93724.1 Transmembrane domain-containing protein [Trepomonas sp. PC1]